jgi:hypothetical protein
MHWQRNASFNTLLICAIQETDQKANLEKLRADAKRARARLAKIEEDAAKIKFPMKDELLVALMSAKAAAAGSKPAKGDSNAAAVAQLEPMKEIPSAVLQVGTMLAEELVNDAIGVWDFINVFRSVFTS